MIADDYYPGAKQMKITKTRLKEIIREEVSNAIAPNLEDAQRAVQEAGQYAAEAVTKVEEGMPSSVAKHKQKLADMSDEEFAEKHGSKSEEQLRQMAWRHGYGKMSPHYWNRVKKS